MEVNSNVIKGTLVQRLQNMGVETCIIPGLLKQVAGVLFSKPYMTRESVNRRLAFLGWGGIELDEHTFQLAVACFEAENISSVNARPAEWYMLSFAIDHGTS